MNCTLVVRYENRDRLLGLPLNRDTLPLIERAVVLRTGSVTMLGRAVVACAVELDTH